MHYVFVHGEPSNAIAFSPFCESIASAGTVHCFEAPDHGAAPDSPTLSLLDWANALERYVRSLDERSVLVGHSLGAWAIARVLPALGTRVSRAVFLGGLTHVPEGAFAAYEELAGGVDAGAVSLDVLVDVAAQVWLSSRADQASQRALIRRMFERESMPRLSRALRRLRQLEGTALVPGRFETESVSVHARGDRAVPLASGRELAALGGASRFIEIDDDGHFVHWDHPDVVRDAILR